MTGLNWTITGILCNNLVSSTHSLLLAPILILLNLIAWRQQQPERQHTDCKSVNKTFQGGILYSTVKTSVHCRTILLRVGGENLFHNRMGYLSWFFLKSQDYVKPADELAQLKQTLRSYYNPNCFDAIFNFKVRDISLCLKMLGSVHFQSCRQKVTATCQKIRVQFLHFQVLLLGGCVHVRSGRVED